MTALGWSVVFLDEIIDAHPFAKTRRIVGIEIARRLKILRRDEVVRRIWGDGRRLARGFESGRSSVLHGKVNLFS